MAKSIGAGAAAAVSVAGAVLKSAPGAAMTNALTTLGVIKPGLGQNLLHAITGADKSPQATAAATDAAKATVASNSKAKADKSDKKAADKPPHGAPTPQPEVIVMEMPKDPPWWSMHRWM